MNQGAFIAPALALSTLGPLGVSWDDRAIARLGNGKLAALLVYLAVEPGQHRREALADLFWPDLPTESARLNLRQTIFQLRNVLQAATGRDFIAAGRHHLGLAAEYPLRMSAIDFAAPLPTCVKPDPAECSACLARLGGLADLYRGPFLADVSLPDCPGFEDWLLFKRDSLHRRALDLLARLADCHEQRGDYRAALSFALRYVELEPWSEAGHLRAMRLYALDGRHEAALAQYENCRRALEQELGVVPNAELQQFAERIRADGLGATVAPAIAPIEERRQVTVLYCEISPLDIDDPEDAMAALRLPQARCREIIGQYAGYVVQVYSGGLLAYFGYPQALENAALYAVRAARALAAESSSRCAVRVGVHSGLIVTSAETRAPDAIGTTSSIAVRLRELAMAGEVVVSAQTRQRVTGYFHFAAVGKRRLHGQPRATEAYKAISESGARHRLAAADRLVPFTGRDAELAGLLRTWGRARHGEFNALLLNGEAGIGKSRLADALVRRIDNGSGIVRELRCFPESRQSSLQPVIALLAGLSGFAPNDDAAARLAKLDLLLRMHSPELAERGVPLLGQMMRLLPPSAATPAALKEATRDLLIDLLYALASRHPVLLVVEDLHWCDDLTLDVLSSLIARRVPAPILVLMTARPEWQPTWPQLKTITLAPLPDADVDTLIGALRADLGPSRRARIVALAEGVPLFAEELAAMADGGDNELPTTLHDLLMARLDSLGPARALAQWAATVGREFDMDLLAAVSAMPPGDLAAAAARLRDSGLVRETVNGRLQFKHALVQEAAYLSQTRAARKAAHRRVAEVLCSVRADDCRDRPELQAGHWTKAGEAARAVPLWLAAGRQAAGRFAHRAAVTHYESGLAGLAELPAGEERDRLEFALLVGLTQSEQAVIGYGRGRSAELLADAVALVGRGAGSAADLFQTVWGLWEGAGSRAGHREAVRLAQRLIDIAQAEQSPDLLLQGEYALGNSLFWIGDLSASRRHLETALAMLSPDAEQPLRDCYGSIVAIGIKVYLSWVLWLQGQERPAAAYSAAAMTLARRHGDDYGLAFALTFAATLQRWQGNVAATRRLAEEGHAAAMRCESKVFAAALSVTLGWAEVMAGDALAVTRIEHGIGAIRTAMSGVVVPLLAPYAEALLSLGEVAKALPIVDEALQQLEATQGFHYQAELQRMKGLCLLARKRRRAARSNFEKALMTAREQGAVAFASRAQENLAQLPAGD